jgi:hypothetical protein
MADSRPRASILCQKVGSAQYNTQWTMSQGYHSQLKELSLAKVGSWEALLSGRYLVCMSLHSHHCKKKYGI